jgi:hypothetical protein
MEVADLSKTPLIIYQIYITSQKIHFMISIYYLSSQVTHNQAFFDVTIFF